MPGVGRCSTAETHEVRKGEDDHRGPDPPAPRAARTTDRPRGFPRGAARRGGVEERGGDPARGPGAGPGTAEAPWRPPAEGPDPRSGEATGTPLAQQRRRPTEGSYAQRSGAGRAGKRDAPGRGPGIGRRTDRRRGAPTAEAVGPGATGNRPDAVGRRPAPGSQRPRSQHRVGALPRRPGRRPRAALPPRPRAPTALAPPAGPSSPPPPRGPSARGRQLQGGRGRHPRPRTAEERGRAPVQGGGTAGSEGRGAGPRESDTAGPAGQQARAPPPHAGALPGRRPPPEPPRPGPAARPACPAPPRAAEGPGHRPRRPALIEPDPEAHVEGGGPDPGRRTLGERAGEVMLRAFGELRFSFPLD